MNNQNQLPKLVALNTSGIIIKNSKLYYNNKLLHVQSGIVQCPYGLSDTNRIKFKISSSMSKKVKDIETLIQATRSCVIEEADGDYLDVYVSQWTKLFDNNKEPLEYSFISTEFIGSFLLDVSSIYTKNEELSLNINVVQILVRSLNKLPTGCQVFKTIKDLREHLRKTVTAVPTEVEECVNLNLDEVDDIL